MKQADAISQSQFDLVDDFSSLKYLLSDIGGKAGKILPFFNKSSHHVLSSVFSENAQTITQLCKTVDDKITGLTAIQNGLRKSAYDATYITNLTVVKYEYINSIRFLNSQLTHVSASDGWQSPTFAHSLWPMNGREIGKIKEDINDYKRDQHLDGSSYESKFLKEYIQGQSDPLHIFVTSSGMSAFATILIYLLSKPAIRQGRVIVGKNAYWEMSEQIIGTFGAKAIIVDESNQNEINRKITHFKPKALFFDTFGNTPDMLIPRLNEIAGKLSRVKEETFLVVDNTSAGLTYQSLKNLWKPLSKTRLIVFESLNKLHQFGLDQVMGGIIYTKGGDTVNMFDTRVHNGTNIPYQSAVALPTPNYDLLNKRIKRLGRNANLISQILFDQITKNSGSILDNIVYPGLPNHPCFDQNKKQNLFPPYFMLSFKNKFRNNRTYRNYIGKVIRSAQLKNINIVSGTSFGLDITRIYLTAVRSKITPAFIRVAVGTEHVLDIQKQATILFESSV